MNIPINGPIIMEKANSLSKELKNLISRPTVDGYIVSKSGDL